MFLPALRFPNHEFSGWQAAGVCIDDVFSLRQRCAPSLRILESPPQFAMICGVQCLAGFGLVVISLSWSRPSVVWFRLGTSLTLTFMALWIPVGMEDFRARKAALDDSCHQSLSTKKGLFRKPPGSESRYPDVSTTTTAFPQHRNWSLGYAVWTTSFAIMAAASILQMSAQIKQRHSP